MDWSNKFTTTSDHQYNPVAPKAGYRSSSAFLEQHTKMVETEQDIHVRPRFNVSVTEAPKFDLQSYISNYRGRTVFRRLYLVASCCAPLQDEAVRLAVTEAKKGKDIDNYNDATQLLSTAASGSGKDSRNEPDAEWLSHAQKKNEAETKRLENELKQYKNNLIRESIRMGSEELGVHYHQTGDLANALKSYNRMRDYCTSPSQIISTAFRVIAVCIEQKNWLGVQSQVTKIRGHQMKPEEAAKTQPRIAAADGLQHMCLGEYREAANSFLTTEVTLGDSYNEVISSNDVAVYGGLCALASMNRSELQSKVLDNTNFRSFLELEPHIRRAINYFCASKYSQCLEILESYRADYLLDIYLQDQLSNIYQKIRTKSIVQYFQPFSRVTLDSMEQMFGGTIVSTSTASSANGTAASPSSTSDTFRNELISMIQSDALKARIDLENNVLVAYEESPRAVMQQQAIDSVDNFIREARIKLLRLNAINGGLDVKPVASKPGKGGHGAGGAMDIAGMGDASGSGNGVWGGTGHSLRSGRG